MKRVIQIMFVFLCSYFNLMADNCQDNIDNYKKDTNLRLKNKYYIEPQIEKDNDRSYINLILMNKNIKISTVSSGSCEISLKNIGYILTDFLSFPTSSLGMQIKKVR